MFSTRDSVVIAISGLVALGVAYWMHEAGRREQRDDLQAMEARLLAKIEAAATATKRAQAPAPAAPTAPAAPPQAPPPPPTEQAIAAPVREPNVPAHPLLGSWRCAFRADEYSYPPMACEIRRDDGAYTLEKTQGSQRIKGKLALEGEERFTFSGLFFCPYGACDAQVKGAFTRKGRDHWVGTLNGMDSGSVVVTMRRPAAGTQGDGK